MCTCSRSSQVAALIVPNAALVVAMSADGAHGELSSLPMATHQSCICFKKALYLLQEFNPQSLSNVLWAFASLKHHLGNALLDASAAHAVRCVDQFTPQVCLHNGDCFIILINNMSVALHTNCPSACVAIFCHKSCCICDLTHGSMQVQCTDALSCIYFNLPGPV